MILTVAAVCCAVINFQQQSKFHLPDDGVTWVDRPVNGANAVIALHVVPDSPADKSGIRPGDRLIAIKDFAIGKSLDVPATLQQVGIWTSATYHMVRNGIEFRAHVVVADSSGDSAIYYQYAVGFAYLLIGLFVFFRRGSAPHAVHFYILCLASFVLSCFHYTGKLNAFDEVIYAANVVAGMAAPAVFLHFCLVFPETPGKLRRRLLLTAAYLPAAILLALYVLVSQGMLRVAAPLVEVRWFLDRIWLAYFAAAYVLGAAALSFQLRRAEDTIVRRQLKYLRNGALAGIIPFTLVYVLPYLAGATPGHYQRLAVLSLVFIPITWAYAILRYRLMDVDVIFQQGYVYTLATLCVLGIFYGLIFSFTKPEELSPVAIVGLILFATFIFQPIREWIQEQLDRNFFYKDRYDSRRTLIEFARELSSETNLDDILESLGDRLVRTLSIPRIAFFLADENEQRFQLRTTVGDHTRADPAQTFDLSFLGQSPDPDKPYLFFERTRHMLDVLSDQWPPSVRRSIADLDLTYYFACSVRGRTIAYLGVSRTDKGDFLTSDDVDLLTTLSGYIAIAVENARLYHSLQQKAEEYERLKEFSENIVESINVGILAADLDDRVESWNTQIEKLTGIPRKAALGRRLSDLFPESLQEQLEHVRGDTGVHNVYKFVFSPAASPYARRNEAAANGAGANGHGGNGAGVSPPRDAILNIAIAPLVSKEFKQIGRLIIFDDVTDRDELERRLVQADKLSSIGLLAAGVAHEVNTPLAVISTYAQMLAKQISGQDQQSKLLEKIAKQTFRASEIVNSLLNFSRTSTTEYLEVQLNRIIQETLNLLEHQLQKSGVRVEVVLDDRLPLVKGNPGKLQQVFLNLFLNARDAMEAGGTLSVHSWNDDALAYVEVLDTGQGIAAGNLARVFDPFFTTKGAKKGTGLGLSVTYGIVREHGGSIEVESQPGAGARFLVEIPLARKPVHA